MFAWEGKFPQKNWKKPWKQKPISQQETVCIQGKEQAVAAVTVSGLQELLGGKFPEELDEEKKAELQKLLYKAGTRSADSEKSERNRIQGSGGNEKAGSLQRQSRN